MEKSHHLTIKIGLKQMIIPFINVGLFIFLTNLKPEFLKKHLMLFYDQLYYKNYLLII